jgi:hypothetical protein
LYLNGWSGRTDPDGNLYNFVSCKAPPALNGRSRQDPAEMPLLQCTDPQDETNS